MTDFDELLYQLRQLNKAVHDPDEMNKSSKSKRTTKSTKSQAFNSRKHQSKTGPLFKNAPSKIGRPEKNPRLCPWINSGPPINSTFPNKSKKVNKKKITKNTRSKRTYQSTYYNDYDESSDIEEEVEDYMIRNVEKTLKKRLLKITFKKWIQRFLLKNFVRKNAEYDDSGSGYAYSIPTQPTNPSSNIYEEDENQNSDYETTYESYIEEEEEEEEEESSIPTGSDFLLDSEGKEQLVDILLQSD